ncbi:SCO family protein [Shewanella ulleungensis]|uniref:SCO family protein n=1 Tax=Shewanella ulleungensis TaxID=2282699 RepID=A0ABQ2QHI3_9GAMM|nr:SCO family protein [Shewanella ulleungensis]MCL1152333.1 SCO family protein [Shewanella ulleungensis]GGP82189.1 SCO family protein [Shewanella ulleungensis]
MKKWLNLINVLIAALAVQFVAMPVTAHPSGELALAELPYYGSADFTPHWFKPDSPELAGFHQVPAFSFTDQQGEIVTQNTVKDKIYVASFFFTRCPGICPRMKSQLSKVQSEFIDDDDVMILSHSIQPGNDTVEVLQQYAKKNHIDAAKWLLVTGEREQIYSLAKKAYFANEDLGEYVSKEDFLHTENLVLVDKNRHIRGIYNGLNNTSVANLITDIKRLIGE